MVVCQNRARPGRCWAGLFAALGGLSDAAREKLDFSISGPPQRVATAVANALRTRPAYLAGVRAIVVAIDERDRAIGRVHDAQGAAVSIVDDLCRVPSFSAAGCFDSEKDQQHQPNYQREPFHGRHGAVARFADQADNAQSARLMGSIEGVRVSSQRVARASPRCWPVSKLESQRDRVGISGFPAPRRQEGIKRSMSAWLRNRNRGDSRQSL